MKLYKFFVLLAIFTVAAIFYVSQQIEATKLGYQINAQQFALDELLDQRQMLLYNVYNLKSPENLQDVMCKKFKNSDDFQILGNKQIIVLTDRKEKLNPPRFFGITSTAEAKTQD